jgi:hypothetical protein
MLRSGRGLLRQRERRSARQRNPDGNARNRMHAFHGNLLAWNIPVAGRARRGPKAILSVAFPVHAARAVRSSTWRKPFSKAEQSGQRRLRLALTERERCPQPMRPTGRLMLGRFEGSSA